MTYVLIAVIVVLGLGHFTPDLAQVRRYDGFAHWLGWLSRRLPPATWESAYALLVGIGVPVLAVAMVQSILAEPLDGVLGLLFAIVALFYAWGPRDLDRDTNAAATAPPVEQPAAAAAFLGGPVPQTGAAMAALVGRAAQRRWFGPLFWFVVLGAFGAILYRLAQLAAEEDVEMLSPAQRGASARLLAILDWPVAWLMSLGMAIATDFDTVNTLCRARVRAAGGVFRFDPGLVPAVTAAAVKADLDESDGDGADGFDDIALVDRGVLLRDALAVVWRVLVVWLAILALTALAGLLT
jgi:AmpE protein